MSSIREKQVYRVDVFRTEEEGETWWGAEGGFEASSTGVAFESGPRLADLIGQIAEEIAHQRGRRPDLTVSWTLDNRSPDELVVIAEREGLELPS